MKVYIAPHPTWLGPYQLAEYLLFWKDPHEDKAVRKLGSWLAGGYERGSWLSRCLSWIHSGKKRKVEIRIDPYDTWNADSTMALIILPLLKSLRDNKQGAGFVDAEDVPYALQHTSHQSYDNQECLPFYLEDDRESPTFDRYEWLLNEIIWAFEQLQPDCDWEDQYWKTHPQLDLADYPEDEGKVAVPVRWKVKGEVDWEGRQRHQARIDNGLRLFGKYFQTLWD